MRALLLYISGVLSGLIIAVCVPAVADNPSAVEPEPSQVRQIQAVVGAWHLIKNEYVDPVDDARMGEACLAGMTALDGQSQYLTEAESKSLDVPPKNMASIGLQLAKRFGRVIVIAPLDSGPAARAGIKSGDIFLGINGQSVAGLEMTDIMEQLRGDAGSEVIVTLTRGKSEQSFERRLKREYVSTSSVRARLLSDGLVYLRISQFTKDSALAVKQEIQDAIGSARPTGFVVDLRNNYGGLLSGVLDVANIFVNSGTILTLSGRSDSSSHTYFANGTAQYSDVHVVVLVNEGTAAGAEILAESLRTINGGRILGAKTFGRGTIQTIFPLLDGAAIKITTARWKTARGEVIDGHGLVPDIELADSDVEESGHSDPWLSRAIGELAAK